MTEHVEVTDIGPLRTRTWCSACLNDGLEGGCWLHHVPSDRAPWPRFGLFWPWTRKARRD